MAYAEDRPATLGGIEGQGYLVTHRDTIDLGDGMRTPGMARSEGEFQYSLEQYPAVVELYRLNQLIEFRGTIYDHPAGLAQECTARVMLKGVDSTTARLLMSGSPQFDEGGT